MSDKEQIPGKPFSLGAADSDELKRRFKIVRADSLADVEGEIILADEATGECCLHVAGEPMSLSFGAGGIKIVTRGR